MMTHGGKSVRSRANAKQLSVNWAKTFAVQNRIIENINWLDDESRRGSVDAIECLLNVATRSAVLLQILVLSESGIALDLAKRSSVWPKLFPFEGRFRKLLLAPLDQAFKSIKAGSEAPRVGPARQTTVDATMLAAEMLKWRVKQLGEISYKDVPVNKLFEDAWNAYIPAIERKFALPIEDIPALNQGIEERFAENYERRQRRASAPTRDNGLLGLPGSAYTPRGHAKTDSARRRAKVKDRVKKAFKKLAVGSLFTIR